MKSITILLVCLNFCCFGQSNDKKTIVKEEIQLQNLINDWHKDAAIGDLESFFEKMDKNAIYLGTDASEKWTTDELKEFCKIHFADGKGWDFKPIKREIYFNEKMDFAWFDEQLNTWMGVCMSSGVLIKTNKGWKIKHYQLSMAVPNDIVNDFIKMVEAYNKK